MRICVKNEFERVRVKEEALRRRRHEVVVNENKFMISIFDEVIEFEMKL